MPASGLPRAQWDPVLQDHSGSCPKGSAPFVRAACRAAAPAHLTMLQSEGYGGGGVQWDVEGMERGGGSACVGLRPFMSPVMAMWVPIMGTGGEKKEEHIVTQVC